MSDLTRQRIDLSEFDDDILTFTMDANGSIALQSFLFICSSRLNVQQFTAAGVIASPGSSTQPGAVTVDVSGQFDTLHPETYVWEFRRTSSNNEQLLAFGDLPLRRSLAATT